MRKILFTQVFEQVEDQKLNGGCLKEFFLTFRVTKTRK